MNEQPATCPTHTTVVLSSNGGCSECGKAIMLLIRSTTSAHLMDGEWD